MALRSSIGQRAAAACHTDCRGISLSKLSGCVRNPCQPTRLHVPHASASGAVLEQAPPASADVSVSVSETNQQPPQQEQDSLTKPIVVGSKPASKALLKRLQLVPQTVLRASGQDDQNTYRAISTIAAAQRQLAGSDRVVVYVPYTKAPTFTAIVLPADAAAMESGPSTPTLVVKGSTDAEALARTLTFDLIKNGAAVIRSAGASSTAKAASALRSSRQQLLKRGYELGVMPQFFDQPGRNGEQMTVLSQTVVIQELPPPEVLVSRNSSKPLDPAARVAITLLQKQRRALLKVPSTQLDRLTQLLSMVQTQQQPAAATGTTTAAASVEAGTAADGASQRQQKSATLQKKKRMLLLWQPASAVDAAEAAKQQQQQQQVNADSSSSSSAAAEAATGDKYVELQLCRSRFTLVPDPQFGLLGPEGPKEARRPAVATAESSASGLAAALISKINRIGAAWLYTDGSAAGNAVAWEASVAAGRQIQGWNGQGGLLMMVDVQQAAVAEDAGQQEAQAEPTDALQQQQPAAGAAGYKLKMLLVRNDDTPRSLLQSPNSPLECYSVSTSAALSLIKFAAAANSFLPISDTTGTGALLVLPAVLVAQKVVPVPASSPPNSSSDSSVAVDYRFANRGRSSSMLPLGFDYSFRVQRFTQELAAGISGPEVQQLRVSSRTDPAKLRDAVVAKVLEGQPASVRFVSRGAALPSYLLGVALTAVAAARVRLQQKGAKVDVGVMPVLERLNAAAAAKSGETGGAVEKPSGSKRGQQERLVYSLRLTPVLAAGGAQAERMPSDAALDSGADE